MIIGAQKAETTSLHYYLDQHPKLAGSYPKELNFFSRDIFLGKDLNWYRKHFTSLTKPDAMFLNPRPSTWTWNRWRQRDCQNLSNMKFIMILREPIACVPIQDGTCIAVIHPNRLATEMSGGSRAIPGTAFTGTSLTKRTAFPSFRGVVDLEFDFISRCSDEGPFILRKGLYVDQIKMYYRYFDADQILILAFPRSCNQAKRNLQPGIGAFLNVNGLRVRSISNQKPAKYPDKITGDDKNSWGILPWAKPRAKRTFRQGAELVAIVCVSFNFTNQLLVNIFFRNECIIATARGSQFFQRFTRTCPATEIEHGEINIRFRKFLNQRFGLSWDRTTIGCQHNPVVAGPNVVFIRYFIGQRERIAIGCSFRLKLADRLPDFVWSLKETGSSKTFGFAWKTRPMPSSSSSRIMSSNCKTDCFSSGSLSDRLMDPETSSNNTRLFVAYPSMFRDKSGLWSAKQYHVSM